MKKAHLYQIGMLRTFVVLSACSKQDVGEANAPPSGHPAARASTSNPKPAVQASISLRGLYSITVDNRSAAWIVTEFENTGNVAISAFKGKWTVTDDLDEKVADKDVRFTGDTPFLTAEGDKSPHVISIAERIVIVDQVISGENGAVETFFATSRQNISNCIPLHTLGSALEDYRVVKKYKFEVEKIVNP